VKKSLAAIGLLSACLIVSAATTSPPSPTIEVLPATGTYVINNDRVNVRAAPDVATGKVITQLNKGAVVEVTEMTTLAYNVNGNVAAWFHLKKPDGWIFGWYLDPME
jgi:hypothetical protein